MIISRIDKKIKNKKKNHQIVLLTKLPTYWQGRCCFSEIPDPSSPGSDDSIKLYSNSKDNKKKTRRSISHSY